MHNLYRIFCAIARINQANVETIAIIYDLRDHFRIAFKKDGHLTYFTKFFSFPVEKSRDF